MLVESINGKTEKRKLDLKITEDMQGNYIHAERITEKTASLYLIVIDKPLEGYIIELAHIGKRCVLKQHSRMIDLKNNIRSVRVLPNAKEILKNIYGEMVYVRFNVGMPSYSPNSFHLIFDNNPKYVDNMNLVPYHELGCTAIDSLGQMKTTRLNAAYIQRVSDEVAVIRLFSGKDGEVEEIGRIICTDTDTIFLYVQNDGFCIDTIPHISGMEFTISGNDNLDGTRIGHIIHGMPKELQESKNICLSLMYKGIENLLKINLPNIYNTIIDIGYYKSFDESIKDVFDTYDKNANSFCKMVGVPMKILQVIEDNKDEIREFQYFIQVLGKPFLKQLNKDEFYDIFQLFVILKNCYGVSTVKILLTAIINTYGKKNILNYMKYLIDSSHNGICKKLQLYYDYVKMVQQNNLKRYGFKWKIKPERIEMMHDRATEIVNAKDDQEIKENYEKGFNKEKEKWNYGYTGDKLMIRQPQDVLEIVQEGRRLHHCVGDYVKNVSDGETVILFVRKTESPDVPYYTLEVKDNRIKQCYGSFNTVITDEIRMFLKEWCKAKNIECDESKLKHALARIIL